MKIKIVGIVSPKNGTGATALSPGVNYRSDLITYIINNSKETDIVKKQLSDPDINVLTGKRFDDKSEDV